MNKHTNWSRLAAGALALSLLSGCGAEKAAPAAESKTVTLDPSNPVSLTVWHYYNGAQQSAFDELVSEFNATVGKEKGIYVEGYSQGSVSDLEKAVAAAAAGSVGWAVCAKIRETSKVPIIMLTAKSEVFDRIQGLEMGADDYIVKPFEMKELIARINAVLRRMEIPNDTSKKLHFDKLTIDLDSYELIVDGKKIDTPPKELELLYHLASTPNRVYTRNQLLDEVWGFDYFGDSRTVDVHIKRLREKVEGVSDQWALKTVWGVGYKFETAAGQSAEKKA